MLCEPTLKPAGIVCCKSRIFFLTIFSKSLEDPIFRSPSGTKKKIIPKKYVKNMQHRYALTEKNHHVLRTIRPGLLTALMNKAGGLPVSCSAPLMHNPLCPDCPFKSLSGNIQTRCHCVFTADTTHCYRYVTFPTAQCEFFCKVLRRYNKVKSLFFHRKGKNTTTTQCNDKADYPRDWLLYFLCSL